MTKKELQEALKEFKAKGFTSIKLSEPKKILQLEYDLIISEIKEVEKLANKIAKQMTKNHK